MLNVGQMLGISFGYLCECFCICLCVNGTQLQQERDELYKTFTENVQKVQHKGNLKSSLLELKLEGLTESVEKTQAQLFSVISASNMDQTAINGVTNKIEVHFL